MDKRRIGLVGRLAIVGLAVALTAAACGSSDDDDSASEEESGANESSGTETPAASRGFDGTTITVAGMGSATNFADADVGAQARFKRANDTDELDGITIDYLEFADDKQDPAVATSEARRLVTQEQIFAIVPNLSAVNPGPYLAQQHVPYVGFAFDNTYCSTEPDDSIWGFGFNGCLVPAEPPVMPDSYRNLYSYVSEKTGEDEPSIVLFSNDNQSGQNSVRFQSASAEGAGFDVVYAEGVVPLATSDYSPYVQDWLSADDGEQPDAMYCLLSVQCLQIWAAVQAAGYEGTFQTSLYTDLLVEPLAGTVAQSFYNVEPNEGLTQLQEDLEAFEPGTEISATNAPAYFAADMFIQALKEVGTNVTPEAVQEALANQTWEIEGFVGPIEYPDSTVASTPSCNSLLESNGTAWTVVVPFGCSDKQYPVE
jgi:ABC-type branched-subunit amino acid transport system substrate-binding protein